MIDQLTQYLYNGVNLRYEIFTFILQPLLLQHWVHYIPMIPLPFGEMFAPMSLLVGFVFVLRDFAQKELVTKY